MHMACHHAFHSIAIRMGRYTPLISHVKYGGLYYAPCVDQCSVAHVPNVGICVCCVPSAVLFESASRSISTLATEIPGCHSGSCTFMNLIHHISYDES